MAKLTDTKASKRFNTKEALGDFIGCPIKMQIINHPASKKVLVGAKDSGKTFIVNLDEIYRMERDPMASHIAARKYKEQASSRLGSDLQRSVTKLKRAGYTFPIDYRKSTKFFVREKHTRDIVKNQYVEFASFEDADALAGITLGNGGYFSIIHIEEPSQANDNSVIEKKFWDDSMKMIKDSAGRSVRDYKQSGNVYHDPIPLTTYITFNDWDEAFCESQDLEHFLPRKDFLTWMLGGLDPDVLLGDVELIDKNWERIKRSMLTNHTKMCYVEFDDRQKGKQRIDTLYVRLAKFANPGIRMDPESTEATFQEIYNALCSGNSFELARVLGMLNDKSDSGDRVHNFLTPPSKQKENPITDTDNWLHYHCAQKSRVVLCWGVGWDVDVSRRLVATPCSISARVNRNGYGDEYWFDDFKMLIHPQQTLEAHGKGDFGQGTKNLALSADEITMSLKNKYERQVFAGTLQDHGETYCLVDDMTGGLCSHMSMVKNNFAVADYTVRQGDWDILHRQDAWQYGIDSDKIIIDASNVELIDFLENVKKRPGQDKRLEKGRFEKLADYVNSAEAIMYPFSDFHEWEQDSAQEREEMY